MNLVANFDTRKEWGNLKSNIAFLREKSVLHKDSRILEIGSRTGGLVNYLLGEGFDVRGGEIKNERISEGKRLYGNLPLEWVSSEILPFSDNTFDIVLNFDVFKHIPNSDLHLQEVKRVLQPEGFYLLQTPNKLTNVIFETIRWKSFTKWQADHCSLHSYWGIQKRLQENKFEKILFHDISVVNEFFKRKVQRFLGKPGLLALKLVNPDRLPLSFRTNFYISARSKAIHF